MPLPYNITTVEGRASITVLVNGKLLVATDTHPAWDSILEAARSPHPQDADTVEALFDATAPIAERFDSLSERVSVAHGRIYFDGEEVDNSLTQQVIRFLRAGLDFTPLVRFFEKVQTNPNPHSRAMLFDWLRDRDFTITSDGDFLAYKGVRPTVSGYESISRGTAIVNGETQHGAIRNDVGDVVTMPRAGVAFDPEVGCSTGLHAGTWDYAHGFARGAVLTVRINPRDVVSVPTDSSAAKLRVCRYLVVEATEVEYQSPLWADDDAELCPTCDGDGYIFEEVEVAYGVTQEQEFLCDTCNGEGYVEEDVA